MPRNNSAARRAERRKDAERRFASSKHSKVGRKANLLAQELDYSVYQIGRDGTTTRRPQDEITHNRHYNQHYKRHYNQTITPSILGL